MDGNEWGGVLSGLIKATEKNGPTLPVCSQSGRFDLMLEGVLLKDTLEDGATEFCADPTVSPLAIATFIGPHLYDCRSASLYSSFAVF